MLTEEQAVWRKWLYIGQDLKPHWREGTPEEIKKAYENHVKSGIK